MSQKTNSAVFSAGNAPYLDKQVGTAECSHVVLSRVAVKTGDLRKIPNLIMIKLI